MLNYLIQTFESDNSIYFLKEKYINIKKYI